MLPNTPKCAPKYASYPRRASSTLAEPSTSRKPLRPRTHGNNWAHKYDSTMRTRAWKAARTEAELICSKETKRPETKHAWSWWWWWYRRECTYPFVVPPTHIHTVHACTYAHSNTHLDVLQRQIFAQRAASAHEFRLAAVAHETAEDRHHRVSDQVNFKVTVVRSHLEVRNV